MPQGCTLVITIFFFLIIIVMPAEMCPIVAHRLLSLFNVLFSGECVCCSMLLCSQCLFCFEIVFSGNAVSAFVASKLLLFGIVQGVA